MNTKLLFIIDYASIFRELLKLALEVRGFSLLISEQRSNAEVILDTVDRQPDAILLDATIARANDFSLYRKVHLLRQDHHIPLYILLESIEDEYLFKDMDLDVSAYLFKSQSNISNIILLLSEHLRDS